MRLKLTISALGIGLAIAPAQNAPSHPAGGDAPVTLRSTVQLVTIPAVVRDKNGRAVGDLKQEDFQLFDNGKNQQIRLFSVESAGDAGAATPAASAPQAKPAPPSPRPDIVPDRFVAYMFDDIHMQAGDLMRIRKVAAVHFATALRPGDRGAVYTTSGVNTLEFTSDRDALQKALSRLIPRPLAEDNDLNCPSIGYYQANLIVNKMDPMAIRAAVGELMGCDSSVNAEMAVGKVNFEARSTLMQHERASRAALDSIFDAIRRMEALPGQRSLILVSPGFLTPDLRQEVGEIIHTGIKARVTVSSLDARGLWTDPQFDASVGHNGSPASGGRGRGGGAQSSLPSGAEIQRIKSSIANAAASVADDVMAEVSAGTGGRFFHNSNDLKTGFQQIAAAPEHVYMLAFSPSELKSDGKYHNVKVTVAGGKGLEVDARKGYFAPVLFADPLEQARNDVREAVFSRDQLNDLPVELTAQLVKRDEKTAQIVVQTRLFPESLKLRHDGGRRYGQVRVMCSVFDANGQYVTAVEKVLDLQMRDEVFERTRESGVVSRTEIDIKPARYLVRVVIRDVEGRQTTTKDAIVGETP